MHEELVLARGRWHPRHRPDLDCWCRPTTEGEDDSAQVIHRHIYLSPDVRERAFVSHSWQPPV